MAVAAKGKSKRSIRKKVMQRLEKEMDISRFNYKAVVRPGKGKAKLIGVAVAGGLYLIGFCGAYIGWLNEMVDDMVLAKLLWIFMVPSSVVGAMTWAIMDSRLEYPIRRSLVDYITVLEGDKGVLWRYEPLFSRLKIKGVNISQAVTLSRNGRGSDIDPQDYSQIMYNLYTELTVEEGFQITGDMSRQLEENFM